jgi:hypothetical protein
MGPTVASSSKATVNVSELLAEMHMKMHRLMAPFADAIPPELALVDSQQPDTGKLEDLGKIFERSKQDPKKPTVMNAIDKFRAKICADMKDDHGARFASYDACFDFMMKVCKPGRDGKMDGDSGENTSGAGYCKTFFEDLEREKAMQSNKDESRATRTKSSDTGVRTQKEALTGKGGDDIVDEKHPRGHGHARAEEIQSSDKTSDASHTKAKSYTIDGGPAPSPSAGGAPGPAGPRPTVGDTVKVLDTANTKEYFPEGVGKEFVVEADLHNDQPYQVEGSSAWLFENDVVLTKKKVLTDDEKWYYKNDGKDPGRYHMDESLKLPTQGYWGKLVEHEDQETSTGDWQKEFTAVTGSDSRRKICEKNPDNMWCQEHYGYMYKRRPERANAATVKLYHTAFALFWLSVFKYMASEFLV